MEPLDTMLVQASKLIIIRLLSDRTLGRFIHPDDEDLFDLVVEHMGLADEEQSMVEMHYGCPRGMFVIITMDSEGDFSMEYTDLETVLGGIIEATPMES